jgi:hypothetical protein
VICPPGAFGHEGLDSVDDQPGVVEREGQGHAAVVRRHRLGVVDVALDPLGARQPLRPMNRTRTPLPSTHRDGSAERSLKAMR